MSLNSHLVSKIFVFSLLCPYYSTCSKCHKTYDDCATLKQLNYRYVRALRQKCNHCDFDNSKSNIRVLRIVTVKAVEIIPAALWLILMEISYHFVLQSESIPFSIFLFYSFEVTWLPPIEMTYSTVLNSSLLHCIALYLCNVLYCTVLTVHLRSVLCNNWKCIGTVQNCYRLNSIHPM